MTALQTGGSCPRRSLADGLGLRVVVWGLLFATSTHFSASHSLTKTASARKGKSTLVLS
jgi:hypothetical protein